ncbi:MAG: Hsp20/alpha crystallin family protein [Candidatus Aminicenantes bacterium]|nr:MAG: Hsp20/alpha crystallin family protein [Candidatus Aminicenantes bacterium]
MVKRIRPISRVVKIEAEINKIMGEVFFRKKELIGLEDSWIPYVDISERDNDITVRVELPGVEQKDISILLHNSRVEIKGIKKENLAQGKIRYHQLEREYGSFRRFIFLPGAVIPERARAILENGVLTLVLKKYRRKKEKEVILKIQKGQE